MYINLKTDYEKFAKPVVKEDVVEVSIPLLSSQVSSTLISKNNIKDNLPLLLYKMNIENIKLQINRIIYFLYFFPFLQIAKNK